MNIVMRGWNWANWVVPRRHKAISTTVAPLAIWGVYPIIPATSKPSLPCYENEGVVSEESVDRQW
jgi:hypothetical protein